MDVGVVLKIGPAAALGPLVELCWPGAEKGVRAPVSAPVASGALGQGIGKRPADPLRVSGGQPAVGGGREDIRRRRMSRMTIMGKGPRAAPYSGPFQALLQLETALQRISRRWRGRPPSWPAGRERSGGSGAAKETKPRGFSRTGNLRATR